VAYTAVYRKTSSGYMGQLVEWPQVVTEGKDVDECRAMLKDALREMAAAYKDEGLEIPGPALYKTIEWAS
jgi:predicted RNase H-like HicB family nuclease